MSFIPKVRIQRKRRPFLQERTNRMFKQARAFVTLTSLLVKPWIDAEEARRQRVLIERHQADTELKVIRQSLAAEQARRQELLNADLRLRMEAKFGRRAVAEAMGEAFGNDDDEFTPINY